MEWLLRPPVIVILAVVSLVPGCGTVPVAPAHSSEDAVRETIAVQELRRDVAQLRNSVEMQRNSLEQLRERQRQLYEDLDARLRQREQAGRSAGRDQQVAHGQGSAGDGRVRSDAEQRQSASGRQGRNAERASEKQVYGQQGVARESSREDESDRRSTQGVQTASRRQSNETLQRATERRKIASAEEQAAYGEAFELLTQSRYADAVIKFRSLIENFPRGALIDDAQYWIGEAYYVVRDFEKAGEEFSAVVSRYPDSQRMPEAMLKLGYIQAETGRTQKARRTLNKVISRYPGSRVAISAETRLSQIR